MLATTQKIPKADNEYQENNPYKMGHQRKRTTPYDSKQEKEYQYDHVRNESAIDYAGEQVFDQKVTVKEFNTI